MLNIGKYKDEILKYVGCRDSLMCLIYENIMKKNDCTGCCSKCKRETIEWLTSEYKEPILTNKEKIIIKNILKAFEPFGKEVSYITKENWDYGVNCCYLNFHYENEGVGTLNFNSGKFFVGMELDKAYTPEELGL